MPFGIHLGPFWLPLGARRHPGRPLGALGAHPLHQDPHRVDFGFILAPIWGPFCIHVGDTLDQHMVPTGAQNDPKFNAWSAASLCIVAPVLDPLSHLPLNQRNNKNNTDVRCWKMCVDTVPLNASLGILPDFAKNAAQHEHVLNHSSVGLLEELKHLPN